MPEVLLDPLTLFFLLGLFAGALRTDLRLPEAIYQLLSIYLLLAIGLKGGKLIAASGLGALLLPVAATLALGLVIPLIAFAILRRLGGFGREDAAAIAAHYGSVSAVTYAVAVAMLEREGIPYEAFVAVLLVVLEVPAIALGIALARVGGGGERIDWAELGREVFLNRSIYLLIGGLLIGALSPPERLVPFAPFFVDLFRGLLAFFLLELGIIVSHRWSDVRRAGPFLLAFGVGMPLLSGLLGTLAGDFIGLSLGGTVVLATMAASASYIAAPAAMQVAVPRANPGYYLGASLGVTFPFNVTLGIPIYLGLARWFAA